MPKGYKHLTYVQRCQIEVLLKSKFLRKDIASKVGISDSKLSRELKKKSNKDGTYNAKVAHSRSKKLKRVNAVNPRKIIGKQEKYIRDKLDVGWSPDQISGRLFLDYKAKISDSAIYDYISQDRKNGGKLYLQLRRKGRKKRDYNRKKASRSLIPNRIDIEQREEIVESKSRIGDWEADTVVGKGHKSGVITLVERYTKLLIIILIKDFKADNIAAKIIERLSKFKHRAFTITFDNGLEFASHTKIKEHIPHIQTYFAKPYKSWQRGLNEHTNGLIRQYFPKGTDFNKVSELQVLCVQNKINFRPRAVLNYKAPEEVFFRCYSKL